MPHAPRTMSERQGFVAHPVWPWLGGTEPHVAPQEAAAAPKKLLPSLARLHAGHVPSFERVHSAPAAQAVWRAPSVPHHLRPKRVHVMPGYKYQTVQATCMSLGLPDSYRIRGLESADGHAYLCTPSIPELRGSSGKARYAMNTRGTLLFIKEVRTEVAFARGQAQGKKMSTLMTPRAMVDREIRLLQAVEPNLDVHDCIDVDGKVYIIMDAMLGDFWTLMQGPIMPRRHLVRTMLAEMARSLQRCHKAGYIHHDVKIENIFWSDGLELVLGDYGYATQHHKTHTRPVPVAHRLPQHFDQLQEAGPPGTHPAPEMCRLEPVTQTFRYDAAIDTWALGMAFALSYASVETSPFRPWRFWLDYGDYAHLGQQIDNYTLWHRNTVHDDGRLYSHRFYGRPHSHTPPCKWDRFFRPLLEADPKLLAFVLRYMLHPDPKARASLAEVEHFCQNLADATPAPIVEAGRAFFESRLRQAKAQMAYHKEALRCVFYDATHLAEPHTGDAYAHVVGAACPADVCEAVGAF